MSSFNKFMKESKVKLNEASAKAKEKKETGDWKKIGRGGHSTQEENTINARPLAALKDVSQFPAPPKKRSGPPQLAPPAQSTPQYSQPQYQQPQYQQPQAQQYQYQQPAAQSQYQPPAQPQYQPPAQAGYQPPPPPGVQHQPPPGPPPQSQYQPPPPPPPVQNQYQPTQSHYPPPAGSPAQYQQPVATTSYQSPPPPPPQPAQGNYAPPVLPSRSSQASPQQPQLPPRENTPEVKPPLPDPNSFPLPPRFGDPSSAAIRTPNQSTPTSPPPPQPGAVPSAPNEAPKPPLPDPTSFPPPPTFGRSAAQQPPPPPSRTSLPSPNGFHPPPNAHTPTAAASKPPPPPRPVARPDNPAPLPPRLPTRQTPPAPSPAPQAQPEFADAPPPSHPPPPYIATEQELANQTRALSIDETNSPQSASSQSPQPQQPNFAAEIANLRSPSSNASPTAGTPPNVPPTGLKKKKPPPPPKPKKPHLLRSATGSSVSSLAPSEASAPSTPAVADTPPPLNLANKPSVQLATPPQQQVQSAGSSKRFDLDLISAWFTKQPIQLPKDLQGYNHTYSTRFGGDDYALNLALRIPHDLSIVKFHFTWKNSNPLGTVQVQREDVPPPPELSPQELYNYSEQFGNQVASWAESQMGTQVGNGECWTLAQQAIIHGTNKVGLASQGLTHGSLIYHINASSGGPASPLVHKDYIRRGDIIQYKQVVFQNGGSTSTCGSPDHTSIVTGLDGDNINVVHQNTGGVKRVCTGSQNFAHMTSGDLKVFRVVPSSWAGELKA